jgi:glycosyltransferase involved in cell wall biosynthesis
VTDTPANHPPAVSVVIPTRNRPTLVREAIFSVLEQSLTNLELIVIIDGEDEATEAITLSITDPRLRIHSNIDSVGGAQARNIGVKLARAEWVAFLDDDDVWLPQKLAKQMELAKTISEVNLCVACRFIARSEHGDRILPLRAPDRDEPLSEYIYCPRGLSVAEGFVQTSTLLVRRELMLKVPFLQRLACGQETTWLLRASRNEGLRLIILPEPLVIFNDFASRSRISIAPKWRTLLDWAMENRSYYTPKAYSFFTSTICIQYANTCNEPFGTYVFLIRECFRGRPTLKCVVLLFYRWLMPETLRRRSGALVRNTLNVIRGAVA